MYPINHPPTVDVTSPKINEPGVTLKPEILLKFSPWNQDWATDIAKPGKSITLKAQTRYITPTVNAVALAIVSTSCFIHSHPLNLNNSGRYTQLDFRQKSLCIQVNKIHKPYLGKYFYTRFPLS